MTVEPANLAVAIDGAGTAQLTWDPSTDPGLLDYSVFRRTPSTGSVFVPGVGTPVASGLVVPSYADTGLASARYDWQVFARLWTPADWPGIFAAFNFADTATITASAGAVSAVAGAWGTSVGVAQGSGPSKPATGVDTINGLNTLKFAGAQNLNNLSVAPPATNTITCLAVVKPSAAAAYERVLSLDAGVVDYDNAQSIAAILRDSTSGNFGSFYNGSMRAEKALSNAAHVIVTQRQGDTHRVWVDGVAGTPVTGLGTTNFGWTRMWIGNTSGADGPLTADLGALLISTAAVGTSDRQLAEAYFKAVWNTP